MPDTWINLLVVSGPVEHVASFERTVTRTGGESPTSLSFKLLHSSLPPNVWELLEEPYEPWSGSWPNDDGISAPLRQEREEAGLIDLVYDLSLARYAGDDLLTVGSLLFPRLCFVFGWVAPNVDEHKSIFIHNGDADPYEAPPELVEQLRSAAYRKYGLSYEDAPVMNDDGLWADIEGDWALLDAVVEYWDDTVRAKLRQLEAAHLEP